MGATLDPRSQHVMKFKSSLLHEVEKADMEKRVAAVSLQGSTVAVAGDFGFGSGAKTSKRQKNKRQHLCLQVPSPVGEMARQARGSFQFIKRRNDRPMMLRKS